MGEQRRFERHGVSLEVSLFRGHTHTRLVTGDISRHGAFVQTDDPAPLRELVRLKFQVPGHGELEIMGMVARTIVPGEGRRPGMGIDFFAMSRDVKDIWDRFVLDLEQTPVVQGEAAPALPPPIPDDDSGLIVPPIRRQHPRAQACFLVRLQDRTAMQEFLSRDISQGGVFLATPIEREIGDPVELVLVHPETEEEFALGGTVRRVEKGDDGSQKGLGIQFIPLDKDRRSELASFVGTGVDHLERKADPDIGLREELELEARMNPQDPEPREALGVFLLKKGDIAAAVRELVEVARLAPSRIEVHAALSQAYMELGDRVRARGHERVATCLHLYREDIKDIL